MSSGSDLLADADSEPVSKPVAKPAQPGSPSPPQQQGGQGEAHHGSAAAAEKLAIAKGVMPKEMEREEGKRPNADRTSHFDGPCKECCVSCVPLCCVSADGETLYGCVPTQLGGKPVDYVLPLCLHTCLCPQQGGHPCPERSSGPCETCLVAFLFANSPVLFCPQYAWNAKEDDRETPKL